MLVSNRKRYLSGHDWAINTLDYMMKSLTSSGNMSQIVLVLDGHLDEADLHGRVNRFLKRFPVLEGTVARDFKLTPYWKIPSSANRDVTLKVTRIDGGFSLDAVFSRLQENANSKFRDDKEHIAFHLFTNGTTQSALAMTFDHRLFDARGAEAFLNLLQQNRDNHDLSGDIRFTSSMALTQWKNKFLAGRSVNRRIIALSESTPKAFPFPEGRGRGFTYRLLAFTEQETSEIYARAYHEAGYLMESPFFLAAITRTIHGLFSATSNDGTSYVIPVSTDLRPGKEPLQEIFFNHISFLFFQISLADAADRNVLLTAFKRQMYDQVKSGFPKDLSEASLLTRIAPLPVLAKLLYLPMKGRMATFAFSHLGKSAYLSDEFMGRHISNFFHMPRVPVPPGIGFFSNYYNGRLNLTISYLDGLLTDEEISALETGIRLELGASPS